MNNMARIPMSPQITIISIRNAVEGMFAAKHIFQYFLRRLKIPPTRTKTAATKAEVNNMGDTQEGSLPAIGIHIPAAYP